MDILLWVIISVLFLFSFIGIVMPIIPGAPLIWVGIAVYYFGIEPITGWGFWTSIIILSLASFIVDYISSVTFVKKWGGSKSSKWAVIIGLLIGPLLMGPIGVLVGPFIFVVLIEIINGANYKDSIKIGFASFLGLLGGGIFKGLIYILMIIIFILKVL